MQWSRRVALLSLLCGGCSAATDLAPTGPGVTVRRLEIAEPAPIAPDFFGRRTVRLAARTVADDGTRAPLEGGAVRWTVSDTAIATVDSAGVVAARRIGTVLVVGEVRGAPAVAPDSVAVAVVPPPDTGLAVIAHRGFALAAPENTIPAIERAFELGADAVEVDVALTVDSVPVLMHDFSVDRTTDGSGLLAALTAARVRTLDACSHFGRGWAPCPVPTLDEALAAAARQDGRRLVLDLKGGYTPAQLRSLLRQVAAHGLRDRVMFADFDLARLAVLRAADPSIALGHLTSALVPAEKLTALGAVAALYNKAALAAPGASEHLRALRAAGVDVGAWTLLSSLEAQRTFGLGVRRIITDVPLDRGIVTALR